MPLAVPATGKRDSPTRPLASTENLAAFDAPYPQNAATIPHRFSRGQSTTANSSRASEYRLRREIR